MREFRYTESQIRRANMTSKSEIRSTQKAGFADDAAVLAERTEADTLKRYTYLLGQTDIFAHFLNLKDLKGKIDIDSKASAKRKADAKSEGGSQRHRLTEAEEDSKLLNADETETETVELTSSPAYVKNGVMRDYQVQGLNWLISLFDHGINGILADEMGLGKTLQTISFLGYLKHFKNISGPHLVIVPKSTLHNWMKEFAKWVPDLKVFLFHGAKDDRAELVKTTLLTSDFDVCVTSFEMCLLEKVHFKKFSWQYIIIDEAHRIKNENSALSQIVRVFNCRNRLLLTGTPLQNNLHELWALLNFLLPDVFKSASDFDSWFELQGGDQDAVVQQLHKVLRPFLLRRIKADVEKSLLPKERTNLYVGMSAMQKKWYQKLLEKDIAAVNGVSSGRDGKTRLLNIVMQLRKCANHPYLFDGAEPGPPYTTDMHLVHNSGKMAILDRLLPLLQSQGSRVLIFSQMSRMLDILEDYCVFKEFEYCRIDGNTAHEDRVSGIDEYNAPNSKKFIFLLTTRAGGLGINLATADIVIMYDNDWNPQCDLQAEDRAHRIGQKKQVKVFRFITEDSVEEKIIDRATQKLRLDQLVIQQGRAVQQNKAANKDELLTMIRHGASTIFSNANSTITNDSIESILQRSIEKTSQLEAKYKEMGLDDLQKFTLDGGTGGSVYQWEGEDFSNKRKNPAGFWIQPAKRERKANYNMEDYYREAMRIAPRQVNSRAPKPKQTQYFDYQFFPARLMEIQEKEILAHQREVGYNIPGVSQRSGVSEDEAKLIEKMERIRSEQQELIDTAEPVTEEEIAEKESLLKSGFDSWTRRDFNAFIKSCEKHGRKNLEEIALEVEGKTLEEVTAYSKVFWERFAEVSDSAKLIARIEEGEAKIAKLNEVQEVLSKRVSALTTPLHQLKINYGQIKGKSFSEEEDRFLLVMLDKFGYGDEESYEKIRQEIKRSSLFRFNWFFKSRNSVELNKRCSTLLLCLMKEHEEETSSQATKKAKTEGVSTKSFFASRTASAPRKQRK